MVDYKAYKKGFRKKGEALRARLRTPVRSELPRLAVGTQELLSSVWVSFPLCFGIRLRKTIFRNRKQNTAPEFGRWLREFILGKRKPFRIPNTDAKGRSPFLDTEYSNSILSERTQGLGSEFSEPSPLGIRLRKWVFRNRRRNTVKEFGGWLREFLIGKRKPFRIPNIDDRSKNTEYGNQLPDERIWPIRIRWDLLVLIGLVVLVAVDSALASRLESAARNAQASVVSIAQITSTIGIALGGLLMSVGWAGAGRQVLGGGVVGAFASFGGPALIDFVRSVF